MRQFSQRRRHRLVEFTLDAAHSVDDRRGQFALPGTGHFCRFSRQHHIAALPSQRHGLAGPVGSLGVPGHRNEQFGRRSQPLGAQHLFDEPFRLLGREGFAGASGQIHLKGSAPLPPAPAVHTGWAGKDRLRDRPTRFVELA